MSRTRWHRAYVLANVPLTILIFALPRFHAVLWGALGLGAAAAVVAGCRLQRAPRRLPWLLVALALATFVSGDVVYDLLTGPDGEGLFPSAADGLYLLTYPLFAGGLLAMVRARTGERDTGALLDALTVTTACGLLSWLYLIQPYVRADDMTSLERAVSIAYPLGDIAILCVLARLLAGGGRRQPALWLLVTGAAGLLAADVAYGTILLHGTWAVGGPTDLGWVIFYVCWGAAALHPSMASLTLSQPRRPRPLSPTTLAVLTATTLVAPALLVWRSVTGGTDPDSAVIGAASAALFILVLARLTGLARAHAAQAGRERALRASGERLVAVTDLDGVVLAAADALRSAAEVNVEALFILEADAGRHRVVAGWPSELVGQCLTLAGDIPDLAGPVWSGEGLPAPDTLTWRSLRLARTERRLVLGCSQATAGGADTFLEALAAQLSLAADHVELAAAVHRRKVEARFRSLVQNGSDVILVLTAGSLKAETPSVEAVLGYGPGELGDLSLGAIFEGDDAGAAESLIADLRAGRRAGPVTTEWRARHRSGRLLDTEVILNDLSADPHVGGVVITLRDVSDRKTLESELRHQAFHDSLTGLANRLLFNDRVDHALSRRSVTVRQLAVLLIDVDDFKLVNDTLGHAAGDELLQQIAQRIVECLRGGDTAARLGGDEFAVCLDSGGGEHDVVLVAQRILDALRRSYPLAGAEINVRASIGVALAGPRTRGAAEMLQEADLALYAAKGRGKGSYYFFEPGLHQAAVTRLERRAALEQAIEQQQLRLHYQPVVELAGRGLVTAEALVRWQQPLSSGLVPPAEFIPLAEESGLIVPLGRWVIDQACADLALWRAGAVPGGPVGVSVNVSPRQLQAVDFLDTLDAALARNGLLPHQLTLEITENLLMQDSLDVMARLAQLHDRGVNLALDDFGTGYSSLSYLNRFPIQVLKIDRSFVNGMNADAERLAILGAIISLAAGLGLDVVAEGIEDEAQAARLLDMGCRYGQGYLFGRPAPAGQIGTFASSHPNGLDHAQENHART